MAFHIVKGRNIQQPIEQPRQPMGVGEALLTGAGETLTDILNNFAKNKAYEIGTKFSSSPASQRLQGLNVPKKQADFLEQLSPQEQLQVLQMLGAQRNQQAQQMGTQMQPGQTQPQQASQAPDFLSQLGAASGGFGPVDRKEQRAEEKHQREQQKFNLEEYQKLQPVLMGQSEDFKNAKQIYDLATTMRKNLLENKDQWPGLLAGTLESKTGLSTNPNVRKYMANGIKLALLQAAARKGQPTGYKVKMERETKPDISQPWQTQLELLDEYIHDAEDVFNNQKIMERLKNENGGKYPHDLGQRLIEEQLAEYQKEPTVGSNGRPIDELPEAARPQEGQSDDEGLLNSYIAKPLAGIAANIGSSVAGLPALPGQLAGGVGNYLTGGAVPTYEQAQEKQREQPSLLSGQILSPEQIMNQSALPNILPPTAAQVREGIDEATGGYTKGGGLGENIMAETALSLVPLLGQVRAASHLNKLKTVLGTLGKVSAGNVAAFATEELGGGPIAQTAVKMGVMALAGTVGGRAVLRGQMKEKYDLADMAAGNSKTSARKLNALVNKMTKELGGDKPGKAFIQDRLDHIKENINTNKTIKVSDARELKRNMNAWKNMYTTPQDAKPYLERLAGSLKGTLESYGKKNKTFATNFNEAESLFAGLGGDLELKDFVKNNPGTISKLTNSAVKFGITGGLGGALGKVVGGNIAGLGTGLAAYQGYKFIRLLATSPEALKYYKETVAAGLKNDAPLFIRSAQKLDKVANKNEKKLR